MIDEAREAEAAGTEPVLSFLRSGPATPPEQAAPPEPAAPSDPDAVGRFEHTAAVVSNGPESEEPAAEPPFAGSEPPVPPVGQSPGSPAPAGTASSRAELAHLMSLSAQMACGVARLSAACLTSATRHALAPWQGALRSLRR